MNNFPKENPWLPIDIKIKCYDIQYGYYRGFVGITYEWTNKFNSLPGMKYEIINPDGKVKKFNGPSIHIPKDETYFEKDKVPDISKMIPHIVWICDPYHENDKLVLYPASECKIRHEDKLLQHTRWVVDTVQIGDFVKCSGTRSGDWNKVEALTKYGIYGPKYTKPEEGYMRYTSSDNMYSKIKKIVRNGKELKND